MDITEAVEQRRSIRAFKSDTVPKKVLEELMKQALRAPSWANTQPWEFAIVGGEQVKKIGQAYVERVEAEELRNTDLARPLGYPEPYDTRRRSNGRGLFEVMGLQREDTERRRLWSLQGLKFFGAPNIIIIYIERAFYLQSDGVNIWPIFDCGIVAQSIMLLAQEYGLGTIPEIQAVAYPDVLREVLGIPDTKLIVLGLAIGYPDWDNPVNQFRSSREPLANVVKWCGFD
ncbi:nitroreductase [Chloroflexota bacterium]